MEKLKYGDWTEEDMSVYDDVRKNTRRLRSRGGH